jgi:predicted transcriptional regulator
MNVLARMAEAFYHDNSIKKTHLHSASGTDWNSFEKYVTWMQAKNYIVCNDANDYMYTLTSNGREIFHTVMALHDKIKRLQLIINV